MLIVLGLLVCCAVTYSVRQALKGGSSRTIVTLAALCSAILSIAFLFFLVVVIKPDPTLTAMHTDLTGAMVIGAAVMAVIAVISGCTALVCLWRKVVGWRGVFSLLAVACTCQGSAMFYLQFLH